MKNKILLTMLTLGGMMQNVVAMDSIGESDAMSVRFNISDRLNSSTVHASVTFSAQGLPNMP